MCGRYSYFPSWCGQSAALSSFILVIPIVVEKDASFSGMGAVTLVETSLACFKRGLCSFYFGWLSGNLPEELVTIQKFILPVFITAIMP